MPSAIATGSMSSSRRPPACRSSSSPAMLTRADLEVVLALAVREAAVVELAGLGIDQVGGEGAGVAAEQGVRQRHVAPEEADDVQPREQHGEGVDEPGRRVGAQRLRVEGAVGEREAQVAGDQRGRELLAVVGRAVGDDGDRLDARDVERCSVRSSSYSRLASSADVSLIAMT